LLVLGRFRLGFGFGDEGIELALKVGGGISGISSVRSTKTGSDIELEGRVVVFVVEEEVGISCVKSTTSGGAREDRLLCTVVNGGGKVEENELKGLKFK
jgi:hypothetical protein